MRRAWHTRWAIAALVSAAGCTTLPPIDRYLLETQPTRVRLQGSHGPLSHDESVRILAHMEARSPDTAIFEHHVAIEQTLAGTSLSVGNNATLLKDGPATYAATLAAIRAARSSVHMEMYIFEDGEAGQAFAQALIARRKAGVTVRILYDSVGSLDTPKEFFEGLRNAGIEVEEFNPVTAGSALAKGTELDHRDHRKLVVVDGRVAFLGGINISNAYGPLRRGPGGSAPSGGSGGSGGGFGSGSGGTASRASTDKPIEERPWRDTQVRLEGPVVAELQRTFLAQWGRTRHEPPLTDKALFPELPPAGQDVARAMPGSPDVSLDPAYVTLISAIESSETQVRITNAYFVPAPELLEALEHAARRGVDVELVLPSRSDAWLVTQAAHVYYEDLLESGVKIFERQNRLLHAKTATVDGVWSTIGSTNLDWRSLTHNDELNVVVLSPEFARDVDAMFDADRALSKPITREAWSDRPLIERAKEQLARAWVYLL